MISERGAVPWNYGKMNKIVGSQIYEFMEQKEKFIILILAYEYDTPFLKVNKFLEKKAVEYPDILFGRINIKTNTIFFNLAKSRRQQNQVIVKARGVGSEITVYGNMMGEIEDQFEKVLHNNEYYGAPGEYHGDPEVQKTHDEL
eukprot:sb/3474038/